MEMVFCSWEQAEFPASEFEFQGTERVHKHRHPPHNTLGEVRGDPAGTIPGAEIPAPAAAPAHEMLPGAEAEAEG